MVIKPQRRGTRQVDRLEQLRRQAESEGDLRLWKRATGVLSYLGGKPIPAIAWDLQVSERTPFHWFCRYDAEGVAGLLEGRHTGRRPSLTAAQHEYLSEILDSGPIAYGFDSGVWTGPRVAQVMEWEFDVRYHHHHVPKVLHELGFSVQRPTRRLVSRDEESRLKWVRNTLPQVKRGQPNSALSSFTRMKRAFVRTPRSSALGLAKGTDRRFSRPGAATPSISMVLSLWRPATSRTTLLRSSTAVPSSSSCARC